MLLESDCCDEEELIEEEDEERSASDASSPDKEEEEAFCFGDLSAPPRALLFFHPSDFSLSFVGTTISVAEENWDGGRAVTYSSPRMLRRKKLCDALATLAIFSGPVEMEVKDKSGSMSERERRGKEAAYVRCAAQWMREAQRVRRGGGMSTAKGIFVFDWTR